MIFLLFNNRNIVKLNRLKKIKYINKTTKVLVIYLSSPKKNQKNPGWNKPNKNNKYFQI